MQKRIGISILLIISAILIFKTAFASNVNVKLNRDEEKTLKITITAQEGQIINGARFKLDLEDGVKINTDSQGKMEASVSSNASTDNGMYEIEGNVKNNRILINQSNPKEGTNSVTISIGVTVDSSKKDGIKLKWPERNSEILVDNVDVDISTENSTLQIGQFDQSNNNNGNSGNDNNGSNNNGGNDSNNSGADNGSTPPGANVDATLVDSGKLTNKDGSKFGDRNTVVLTIAITSFFIAIVAFIVNEKNIKKLK